MKKYFAYIRVSTTKQGEQGSSLQEQKAAISAYAERRDMRIIEWFEEQETAASQGRPVFGRMLKGIERKVADGVITHKIDRSARNLKDWAHIGELVERGVEMHFAHESLDLTSRSGRLSGDILAVVASDYIRNLRDEVRKGFYGRLKQGLYPLGAPLGYLDQGGGKPKTIDPVRGPLIAQAFNLYATGLWTLHTLRNELHARGLRNRRGGDISINGISTVLNNPFYIGIIKLRSGEVFQGIHEMLIEGETFNVVADILAGRTPRRGARRKYRYQQLLRCKACGYTLTPERQKGHVYYRCHTRGCAGACLREERIDTRLVEAACRLTFTDEEWLSVQDDLEGLLDDIADERPKQRDNLTLQLAALEDRLERTTDAFIDGAIDKQGYVERKEQLIRARLTLQTMLSNLSHGGAIQKRYATKIFELTKSLASLADSPSDTEIREVLSQTTSNLMAAGKNVEIDWQKPFSDLLIRSPFSVGEPIRGGLRTSSVSKIIIKHVQAECKKEKEEHEKQARLEEERRRLAEWPSRPPSPSGPDAASDHLRLWS